MFHGTRLTYAQQISFKLWSILIISAITKMQKKLRWVIKRKSRKYTVDRKVIHWRWSLYHSSCKILTLVENVVCLSDIIYQITVNVLNIFGGPPLFMYRYSHVNNNVPSLGTLLLKQINWGKKVCNTDNFFSRWKNNSNTLFVKKEITRQCQTCIYIH